MMRVNDELLYDIVTQFDSRSCRCLLLRVIDDDEVIVESIKDFLDETAGAKPKREAAKVQTGSVKRPASTSVCVADKPRHQAAKVQTSFLKRPASTSKCVASKETVVFTVHKTCLLGKCKGPLQEKGEAIEANVWDGGKWQKAVLKTSLPSQLSFGIQAGWYHTGS